jgi:hypothetical protein
MNRLQGLSRCVRRGDRHDLDRAGECIWSALQSRVGGEHLAALVEHQSGQSIIARSSLATPARSD